MYNEFTNYFKQSQPDPSASQSVGQVATPVPSQTTLSTKKDSANEEPHVVTRSPPGLRKQQPAFVSKKPKIGLKGYSHMSGHTHELNSERRSAAPQYLSPKAPLSKETMQEKLTRGKVGVSFADQKAGYGINRSVSPVFMFPPNTSSRKSEGPKEDLKKSVLGDGAAGPTKPGLQMPTFHFEAAPPLPILQPKHSQSVASQHSDEQDTLAPNVAAWPVQTTPNQLGSNRKVPMASLASFADIETLGHDGVSHSVSQPTTLTQLAIPKLMLPDSHKRNSSAMTPSMGNLQAPQEPVGTRAALSKSVVSQMHSTHKDFSRMVVEAVKANLVDRVLHLLTKPPVGVAFDPNFRGDNEWSAMHFACWVGNLTDIHPYTHTQTLNPDTASRHSRW